VRPKIFLSLRYVWCKPCTYIAPTLTPSPKDRDKFWHGPRHLRVLSGASKMISEPMVRSVQTVHLSCIKISTISIWTETSFHFSLITLEYHRGRLKQLLSLWYVRHIPCTYLAPTLTLSRNGPKQKSTWPTSSRSTISCVQKWFPSLWYILHKTVHLSCVKISTISKWTEMSYHLSLITKEYHRIRPK
jgi:hypothetical protein